MNSCFTTIAWVLWIQVAAWGVGRPIYRMLTRNGNQPAAPLGSIFSAALGFIVLANLAFLLAALHLLHAWILIGLAAVLGLGGVAQMGRSWPPKWSRPAIQHGPLVIAALFAATYLLDALSPVLLHDDNVYHLLLPKLYLESHALIRLPSNLYANMPHIVEVLYTAPMAMGDFTAPKILALAFTFWVIAALFSFARPFLGSFGAGLVPLLYLSGKNLQWHLGNAYTEPVIGFFLLCACLALLAWRETGNTGFLRILALACGFALAAKYTAWFYVAAILAVTGFLLVKPGGAMPARRRVWSAVEVGGIALALLAPWLIKNALYTGNPIYPNMYKLLGGGFWSEIQEMHYLRSQAVAGGSTKTLLSFLLLPWRLMTNQKIFFAPCFSISLMILWLASLLRRSTYRSQHAAVLAVSVLGFGSWAFSVEQGRFLVAWLPVMALSAALGLAPLRNRKRVLVALFCAIAGLGVLQIKAQIYPYAPAVQLLSHPRGEFVRKNLNYDVCTLLNKVVPSGGQVLGLWDNRFFFLKRRYRADSAYEAPTGLAQLRASGDAAAFARELTASGVTHVVINTEAAAGYLDNKLPFDLVDERLYPESRLEEDRRLVTSFVQDFLEPLARFGSVGVYRIRDAADAGGAMGGN